MLKYKLIKEKENIMKDLSLFEMNMRHHHVWSESPIHISHA